MCLFCSRPRPGGPVRGGGCQYLPNAGERRQRPVRAGPRQGLEQRATVLLLSICDCRVTPCSPASQARLAGEALRVALSSREDQGVSASGAVVLARWTPCARVRAGWRRAPGEADREQRGPGGGGARGMCGRGSLRPEATKGLGPWEGEGCLAQERRLLTNRGVADSVAHAGVCRGQRAWPEFHL